MKFDLKKPEIFAREFSKAIIPGVKQANRLVPVNPL